MWSTLGGAGTRTGRQARANFDRAQHKIVRVHGHCAGGEHAHADHIGQCWKRDSAAKCRAGAEHTLCLQVEYEGYPHPKFALEWEQASEPLRSVWAHCAHHQGLFEAYFSQHSLGQLPMPMEVDESASDSSEYSTSASSGAEEQVILADVATLEALQMEGEWSSSCMAESDS